jgi:quercetin dioxygenase-like cupin family protein
VNTTQSTTRGRLTVLTIGLLVAAALATYSFLLDGASPPAPTRQSAVTAAPELPPWLRRDIDLAAQVTKYTSAHGGATDLSAQFYGNDECSVHLHLMGPGQFCPLHHHPEGYEFSAIVSGHGTFRGDGEAGLLKESLQPGDVVLSARGSRHEIGNGSATDYLAALVIATPSFRGNLYVHEDSPQGLGRSRILRVAEAPEPVRQIPFAPWSDVASRFVATSASLAGGGTQFLYIVSGRGSLAEADGSHRVPLAGPQLLVVKAAPRLVVSASPETPLHVYSIRFLPAGEPSP